MSYQSTVLGTPGLQALYSLGGAAGNEPDLAGHSNEMVPSASGLTRAAPSLLPNGEGACTVFDGVNGFYEAATSPSLEFGEPCTLEFWGSPVATGSQRVIVGLNTNSGQAAIQLDNKITMGKEGVANWSFTSVPPSTSPAIHHYLMCTGSAGAERKIYIDGVEVAIERPAYNPLEPSALAKAIGRLPGGAFRYSGRLQFVAIYNVVVPAATVLQHYNAGISSPPVPIEQGFFYNSKKVS